jgi:hypothetical protein
VREALPPASAAAFIEGGEVRRRADPRLPPTDGRDLPHRRGRFNGGPGALFLDEQQRLIGVLALDIAGTQITSISSIANPDKLTHLGPVADLGSLRRSAR